MTHLKGNRFPAGKGKACIEDCPSTTPPQGYNHDTMPPNLDATSAAMAPFIQK